MNEFAGKELDPETRGNMEQSFGVDFSEVRIHKNAPASVTQGARAFTQDNHIAFAPGSYDNKLLAHELTHVVQQKQGRVRPSIALESEAALSAQCVAGGIKAPIK